MTDNAPRPSFLVVIPPPVWALLFVIIAWLATVVFAFPTPFRHAIAGAGVFVLGFLISASGRMAFAKVGTEVHPASKKNSTLVASGPFRFTRNPMYLGILVAVAGLALLIGSVPALAAIAVFFLFANFISIPFEEEKMERQFGDAYRAYKKSVRRWI